MLSFIGKRCHWCPPPPKPNFLLPQVSTVIVPIPPFSSLLYSYLPLATFPIPRSFPPPSRFVPDSSPTQIFLPTEAIPCAPFTILKTKSVVLGTGFLSITFRLVCLCPLHDFDQIWGDPSTRTKNHINISGSPPPPSIASCTRRNTTAHKYYYVSFFFFDRGNTSMYKQTQDFTSSRVTF